MHESIESLHDVIIVGGGASGVLMACHLMRTLPTDTRILIVDPKGKDLLGEGLAYSSQYDELLLNVPSFKMGIHSDDPKDFDNWLQQEKPSIRNTKSYPFVPRNLYSQYLRSRYLRLSEKFKHLKLITSRVQNCVFNNGFWTVVFEDNTTLLTRKLVLATGYSPTIEHAPTASIDSGARMSCFDLDSLKRIREGQNVLIVGTGLSAIDAWRTIRARNKTGTIHMLSRHGAFPHPFIEAKKLPLGSLAGMSPRAIFTLVRNLHSALNKSGEASGLYLSLREQFQSIWCAWSRREQRQFTAHLEPLWRVLRHRTPLENHEGLMTEIHNQRLIAIKGRIVQSQLLSDGRAEVSYFPRGQDQITRLQIDAVVIATGPRLASPPAIESSYGLKHEPRLWRIGPANRGQWGEVTAIAEIRDQAELISREMARNESQSSNLFTSHARSQGESYKEHLTEALGLASRSFIASIRLALHALLPFLYTNTASDEIRALNLLLSRRRIASIQRKLRRESNAKASKQEKKAA